MSHYEQERQEKTAAVVQQITSFVNTMSTNTEDFNSLMSREHRTLQNSFTRLCAGWLEHCASPQYRTDPRNESGAEFARTMVRLFREHGQKIGYEGPLTAYMNFI